MIPKAREACWSKQCELRGLAHEFHSDTERAPALRALAIAPHCLLGTLPLRLTQLVAHILGHMMFHINAFHSH